MPGSLLDPISAIDVNTGAVEAEEGIALCMFAEGYRAMLFHRETLIRLNEVGLLERRNRISSVSGGSIAALWSTQCSTPNLITAADVTTLARNGDTEVVVLSSSCLDAQ